MTIFPSIVLFAAAAYLLHGLLMGRYPGEVPFQLTLCVLHAIFGTLNVATNIPFVRAVVCCWLMIPVLILSWLFVTSYVPEVARLMLQRRWDQFNPLETVAPLVVLAVFDIAFGLQVAALS